MAETSIPPLYDEEKALRELARARLKRDELTRQQVAIADRLVVHMQRHFSAEETETAGRALLIGAASCSALAVEEIPGQVIMNILAFAAGHLIADGRAWLEAQTGDGHD
jgi:hypothetical protein